MKLLMAFFLAVAVVVCTNNRKILNYYKPKLTSLKVNIKDSAKPDFRLDERDKRCMKMSKTIPESFDLRDKGAVTSVRHQGYGCYNCWAFVSVGTIEGAYLLSSQKPKNVTENNLHLSEQQIIDCAKRNGCENGSMADAYKYVTSNGGITSNDNYRYRDKENDNHCTQKKYPNVVSISNYCIRFDVKDIDMQQVLLNYGPAYVGIQMNEKWTKKYDGRIVKKLDCDDNKNNTHAVLLIGYTPEYWILKNSYGTGWGENGYLKIARNNKVCGVNHHLGYPLL